MLERRGATGSTRRAVAVALIALFVTGSAQARGYLAAPPDAARFLPPPPTDAHAQAEELAAIREWQGRSTDPRWRQAQADHARSPFKAFATVLGLAFSAERTPKTARLLDTLFADVKAVTGPAKVAFDRPRPPRVDRSLKTCRRLESTNSYPSGHAARGWLAALVLSEMVPEQSADLRKRGQAYGDSRVVCAQHFPSDVQAGRRVAEAVLALARQDPAFVRDLAAARLELRMVLGLPAA